MTNVQDQSSYSRPMPKLIKHGRLILTIDEFRKIYVSLNVLTVKCVIFAPELNVCFMQVRSSYGDKFLTVTFFLLRLIDHLL